MVAITTVAQYIARMEEKMEALQRDIQGYVGTRWGHLWVMENMETTVSIKVATPKHMGFPNTYAV